MHNFLLAAELVCPPKIVAHCARNDIRSYIYTHQKHLASGPKRWSSAAVFIIAADLLAACRFSLGFRALRIRGISKLQGDSWGLAFRVWSLGFKGFRVWSLGLGVQDLGFRVQDLGFNI